MLVCGDHNGAGAHDQGASAANTVLGFPTIVGLGVSVPGWCCSDADQTHTNVVARLGQKGGFHFRKEACVTSHPPHMGSEPAHPVPRRALGPYRVAPIGYGAMRLTGPGVFGPPPDRDDAVQLLRQAVEAGVDLIDTAEYYGPHVVNELIRQALHPYPTELVLVRKVGARRDERGGIFAYDEPAQLRRGIEENLRTLDVDSVHVVNLRLIACVTTGLAVR
jgi:hypothetical protein